MASTTNLVGRFVLPNNAAGTDAVARFVLSGVDLELAPNHVIAPMEISYTLEADGDLPASAPLWCNTEGYRGSFYEVFETVTVADAFGQMPTRREFYVGRIQLGDLPSYNIAERLTAGVDIAPASYWSAITQTQYNDFMAAGEAAVDAADRIDLGALDDAVAATAADAAATEADRLATAADVVTAEAAKSSAETARDAAFANASVYADIATGRAAVADGAQFMVAGTNEIIRYRRDTSTTQTELARYPTVASLYGSAYRAALSKTTRKIVEGSGTISPTVYRAVTWVSGDTYQIEVLARAGERRYLNMYCNGGYVFNVTFDLSLGTCSGAGGSIAAIGEGWFRCRVTGAATGSSSNNVQCRVMSDLGATTYTGDGVSGLYVDNVSVIKVGVGAEILASGDISTAGWTKSGATVTTPTVENLSDGNTLLAVSAAALGVMSADKFVEASGAAVTPSVYRATGAVVIGAIYDLRVVAKAGERHRLNLFNNQGLNFDCTFDLSRGTASGAGASITHLGEDWYECAVVKAATGTASGNCQIRIYPDIGGQPYAGDGVSGLYVNSATLKKDGVAQWSDGFFAGPNWTRLGVTVYSDVALYRTLKIDRGDAATPPYQGLKWAALGTSITAQNQYVPVVAGRLGLTAQNLGVSGGSIASGAHYGSLAIYNAIASANTDTDLVTIEAGINDFGTDNSDLGALGDTTTATFYGALYAAVVAIQARAPSAKIVFLTPYSGDSRTSTHRIFRTNTKGHTLRQFQVAVKEVAAFLGLPCIDVGQAAGLGYLTLGPYSADGLHINASGGGVYGEFVADGLTKLVEAGLI